MKGSVASHRHSLAFRAQETRGLKLPSRAATRPFCSRQPSLQTRRFPSLAQASTEPLQAPRPDHKPPRKAGEWEKLSEIQRQNQTVSVKLESVNKGGAIFKLYGTEGFLPFTQLDYTRLGDTEIRTDREVDAIIGSQVDVKLSEVSEEEGRLVASELAVLRQKMIEDLNVGDVVEGVVSKCKDFGAFVRLGQGKDLTGVEGLIHISELSWNKIFTPEAVVTPGTVVQCKIIGLDKVASKIALSLKQMESDPLEERLDTLLPEDREKIAVVPTNVSQGVEQVVNAIKQQPGVRDAVLGRQVQEKAVSQELEIWMATSEAENEYVLVVREGRIVQEINVQASISKEDMKEMTQDILKSLV